MATAKKAGKKAKAEQPAAEGDKKVKGIKRGRMDKPKLRKLEKEDGK